MIAHYWIELSLSGIFFFSFLIGLPPEKKNLLSWPNIGKFLHEVLSLPANQLLFKGSNAHTNLFLNGIHIYLFLSYWVHLKCIFSIYGIAKLTQNRMLVCSACLIMSSRSLFWLCLLISGALIVSQLSHSLFTVMVSRLRTHLHTHTHYTEIKQWLSERPSNVVNQFSWKCPLILSVWWMETPQTGRAKSL